MLKAFYQNKQQKGFTLVELMIVVAIIGILAAIAIPAFLRYIKQSKTTEAESIMKKMAEGSKAYFTSEQKFNAAANGAEPWHTPGAVGTGSAPGMPVPFDGYVFPGGSGAIVGIDTSLAGCVGNDVTVSNAPAGGSKQIPCAGAPPAVGSPAHAALNKMRVEVKDPLYFKYVYVPTGQATTSTATITAIADFKTGGNGHTIQQLITVDATQEVVVGPPVLTFEFE